MTLDHVRANRDELYEIARRHGVDRLSVVVADPGDDEELPHDVDAYVEVEFAPGLKEQYGALWYGEACEELREEMSALLGAPVGIGDVEGEFDPPEYGRWLRSRATGL
jgi:hypothetical protein